MNGKPFRKVQHPIRDTSLTSFVVSLPYEDYSIPNDPSIHERVGPLPSLCGQQLQQQHLSIMSGSMGFLKNKGSNLFNSVFRTLAKQ